MAGLLRAFNKLYVRTSRSRLTPLSRGMSTKPEVTSQPPKEEPPPSLQDVMKGPVHYPTDFDKRILVFAGRFKKVEDVPKTISPAMFDKARNKARIKLSNYMMLATAIACIFVAISGRRAAERGESVHQMNLDWHKEQQSKK